MCRRDPTRFAYTGTACPDKKDGHCKRGKSCPYSHNEFEYWLHPTRYHTQLCQTSAQCSRPICFFADSSAELREPAWGNSLPQDVLATARLAVSAEVARQNMVDATQDLTADLLLELLANLHLSKKQKIKQTSSRRAMPKHVQDHQRLSLLQPRRNRSQSLEASERQHLALRSFSEAAIDPSNGTSFSNELVLLQAELQSAADLGTTNRAPSSVWALHSALLLSRAHYLRLRFCRENWSLFARSSAQAGTVGVTADGQRRRNTFDEGRRSDDICGTPDINRASQH
ncbi:hypothetical protein WJX77_007994 [Trebouxia sp. C0004]